MPKTNEFDKQANSKLTKETVQKLENAFAIDASVPEACFYANISKQTYYNWIEENPKLKEKFDRLRQKPVLTARQAVNDKLGDSYANAMDYLSRKKKAEFSQRNELAGPNGEPVTAIKVEIIDNKNGSKNERDKDIPADEGQQSEDSSERGGDEVEQDI